MKPRILIRIAAVMITNAIRMRQQQNMKRIKRQLITMILTRVQFAIGFANQLTQLKPR